MRIFLDGKPLSYQLEGERTLSELVSAFNGWLTERKGVIKEVRVDGESMSLEDCLRSERSLEKIQQIHFFTQSIVEFVANSIMKACDEVDSLFLQKRIPWKKLEGFVQYLVNAKKGAEQMQRMFSLDLSKIRVDGLSAAQVFEEVEDVVRTLREHLKRRKRDNLAGLQKRLKESVQKSLVVIADILRGLKDTAAQSIKTMERALKEGIAQIDDLCKGLEQVAVMLQRGEETKAFQQFSEVVWGVEGIMHAVENAREVFSIDYEQIKTETGTLAEKIMELKSLLSEVVTAFENKDYVMLADLLEYELAPSLRGWREPLNMMLEQVRRSQN